MRKIVVAALRTVVRAISKDEAQRFMDLFDGKKPVQKDLDTFVEKNAYTKKDIEELMYDLGNLGVHDLEDPEPSGDKDAPRVESTEELMAYLPDYSGFFADVGHWEQFNFVDTPTKLFKEIPIPTLKTPTGVFFYDNHIGSKSGDAVADEAAKQGYVLPDFVDTGLIAVQKDGKEWHIFFDATDEHRALSEKWDKWKKEKDDEIDENGFAIVDPNDLPKYPYPDMQKNREADEEDD